VRTKNRTNVGSLFLLLVAFALPACGDDSVATDNDGTPGSGTGSGTSPPVTESGCTIFPADNPWNTDISAYPVHAQSAAFIANIKSQGSSTPHADFGTVWNGNPIGIPFQVIPAGQPLVPILFDYEADSDPWPSAGQYRYPIPDDPLREAGSDAHILMLQEETCLLFETWASQKDGTEATCGSGGWGPGSGAIFDLKSNDLRPDGWTSADAAGLPILPALVKYDEVITDGVMNHALRFTVPSTRAGFIHPATHYAGSCAACPPMGLRLRLKASTSLAGCPAAYRPILVALQKYGMFLADNGGNLYISGVPDSRWSDGDLRTCFNSVSADDFEAVETGPILTTSPP
jgi:hypothetical protein